MKCRFFFVIHVEVTLHITSGSYKMEWKDCILSVVRLDLIHCSEDGVNSENDNGGNRS